MIESRFTERAERGTKRGADAVWAAATQASPPRVARLVLATAVPVLAVLAVVVPMFLLNGNGDRERPTSPAATVTTLTPTPTSTASAARTDALPREIDQAYRQCAIKAGFDPVFVQVLFGDDGSVDFVKTGYEVPASIHRLCFMKIGGLDPHTSSYGDRIEPPSAPR